jgi:hypothetical protein
MAVFSDYSRLSVFSTALWTAAFRSRSIGPLAQVRVHSRASVRRTFSSRLTPGLDFVSSILVTRSKISRFSCLLLFSLGAGISTILCVMVYRVRVRSGSGSEWDSDYFEDVRWFGPQVQGPKIGLSGMARKTAAWEPGFHGGYTGAKAARSG